MPSYTSFIQSNAEHHLIYNTYQQEGVDWCLRHEQNDIPEEKDKIKGGIIADDMGLGKTITTIGTMFCNPLHKTLIVVPVSLMGQWEMAVKKYLRIQPILYHGPKRSRFDHLFTCTDDTTYQVNSTPVVVITSYGVLSCCFAKSKDAIEMKAAKKSTSLADAYENEATLDDDDNDDNDDSNHNSDDDNDTDTELEIHPIFRTKWDRIVYDEAHHTRNKRTKKFGGCQQLKTSIKWCVTGTPIQNSVRDLRSLCELLDFTPKFIRQTRRNMSAIELLVSQYVLRRKQHQANITLPPIQKIHKQIAWNSEIERQISTQFTHFNSTMIDVDDMLHRYDDDYDHERHQQSAEEQERNAMTMDTLDKTLERMQPTHVPYNNVVDYLFARSMHMNVPSTFDVKRSQRITDSDVDKMVSVMKSNPLSSIIRARQMCIYPALLLKNVRHIVSQGKASQSLFEIGNMTSKIDGVVQTLVHNATNGNRKIVFCNFIDEMNIIQKRLQEGTAYTTNQVALFSGKHTPQERKTILENDDVSVLIMQIYTASEGLNLQSYNEVYFVSPQWNPSLEDQAIARCYRRGQEKTTWVYHFTMEPSYNDDAENISNMDIYIQKKQQSKRDVIHSIIH
jgi:SNF2 family DNA or RNA helicase